MAADEVGLSFDQARAVECALSEQAERVLSLAVPDDPGADAWGFDFVEVAFGAFREDGTARVHYSHAWRQAMAFAVQRTAASMLTTEEEIAASFSVDPWNEFGPEKAGS